MPTPVICIMGPTACGKSQLAETLAEKYDGEIINVDSAQFYRGLTIGAAKPTPAIQAKIPHHLLDIRYISQPYSAADFCHDALAALATIAQRGRLALCVGGTMLYFRALQQGLSPLPSANPTIRAKLFAEAAQLGWQVLHDRLRDVDPESAARIKPTDQQRIQRALEVYEMTQIPLSQLQQQKTPVDPRWQFINIGLLPGDRELLHQRIITRFDAMLAEGFIDEVAALLQQGLDPQLPALRAVGYRQIIQYLQGNIALTTMREKAIVATRQLAKRQMTWLRQWPNISFFDPFSEDLLHKVEVLIERDVLGDK